MQSRQAHLIGTVGLGIVAFFAVNLRLYSRWTLGGKWNADDWIMLGVSVCFSQLSSCPLGLTNFLELSIAIHDCRLSRRSQRLWGKHLGCGNCKFSDCAGDILLWGNSLRYIARAVQMFRPALLHTDLPLQALPTSL